MHESVHAVASCDVSPIVRIPANEGWMVKRALDAGAHGIIVPLLTSVDDAKRLVQSAKFPPYGKRGFGSPFSMGSFDVKGNLSGFDYMKNANDNLLTIVQIETKEALDCVRERVKLDTERGQKLLIGILGRGDRKSRRNRCPIYWPLGFRQQHWTSRPG
jgi:4-hydroxy-2-oxoheptanedioate aldolase